MKKYIAGPITGIENYKDTFEKAKQEQESKGHKVMNPAILPDGFEHSEYMHICYAMVDVCDSVYLLNGWKNSKGACLEYNYAFEKNKRIEFEE